MDDLKFRRKAYDDPNDQSEEFLSHLAQNPDDEKLVNDLKSLDDKITKALNIDVPEDLADKLILRQQLNSHQQNKRRSRYFMALAASVAFAVGVGFSYLNLAPVNLGNHAIAHIYHEPDALTSTRSIGYEDVNFKLAGISGLEQNKFTQQPGQVYYTTYCNFRGVKSLHMVMSDEHGKKVTLFIVPTEERFKLESSFADSQYKGKGFESADAYMLLVGEEDSDLDYVKREVEQTFI
ncbi:DUF3379 domain-containing protein [Shewanella maritima]|uniref:DUF3379 domain-containing protein n=1 Tax=Shewanella maritima TaxID=2520507 RepID=UPI0037355696